MFKRSSVQIKNVDLGKSVTIIEPSNLYDCKLGDNVFIGPFVEIQRGVVIGKRSKIQSHSFVCELVSIGEDCTIAHGVMFVNDRFATGQPAGGNRSLWEKTVLGNHVHVGSNATILPVMICDDVVIGAGSVVTKNIERPGIYAGNPACFIRELSV